MAEAQTQDNGNGRVTMAVLKATVENLQRTVERNDRENRAVIARNHREVCDEIRDLKVERAKVTDDHEGRIRALEGRNVWGNVADIGAYLTALAGIFVTWAKGSP